MADKRMRKGLDSLRSEIQSLTEIVADLRDRIATQQALASVRGPHGNQAADSRVSDTTREIEGRVRSADDNGAVSLYGFFETSGGNEESLVYRWSLEDRPAHDILKGPIPQFAHMLAAIGHPQRLNILLMLLDEPSTANDVVTQLSLGTTGAAYHHLNVLQAAGFVEQHQRGIFTIVANRIPTLLTILASLSNEMAVEITSVAEGQEAPGDEAEPDDEQVPDDGTDDRVVDAGPAA